MAASSLMSLVRTTPRQSATQFPEPRFAPLFSSVMYALPPESLADDGICHATGPDGRAWPVIDSTHPAFALKVTEGELQTLTEIYVRDEERRARMPRWLQRLFFRLVLRNSLLAQSLRAAEGGFLDGMSTYRFKLGPERIGELSIDPIDRRIAASLPSVSMRLRLQDVAGFQADALAPALAAAPQQPLQFVNLAGGPAMDSVNALLLLQQRNRELSTRPIHMHFRVRSGSDRPGVRRQSAERSDRAGRPLGWSGSRDAPLPLRLEQTCRTPHGSEAVPFSQCGDGDVIRRRALRLRFR